MKDTTIGKEIMRVSFGTPEVQAIKQQFADIFDSLTLKVQEAEQKINAAPAILSGDSIKSHMDIVRRGEEQMRCMAKACEYLELACLMAVKAITA